MPYRLFTKTAEGKKVYCTRNLRTGKVIKYKSKEARERGIRIREAIAHGWRPTKKKK